MDEGAAINDAPVAAELATTNHVAEAADNDTYANDNIERWIAQINARYQTPQLTVAADCKTVSCLCGVVLQVMPGKWDRFRYHLRTQHHWRMVATREATAAAIASPNGEDATVSAEFVELVSRLNDELNGGSCTLRVLGGSNVRCYWCKSHVLVDATEAVLRAHCASATHRQIAATGRPYIPQSVRLLSKRLGLPATQLVGATRVGLVQCSLCGSTFDESSAEEHVKNCASTDASGAPTKNPSVQARTPSVAAPGRRERRSNEDEGIFFGGDCYLSMELIPPAEQDRIAHGVAATRRSPQTVYWASEVASPISGEHYVQARAMDPETDPDFDRCCRWRFVHQGTTVVSSQSTDRCDASATCYVLQHASSGLFAEVAIVPFGLCWLTSSPKKRSSVLLMPHAAQSATSGRFVPDDMRYVVLFSHPSRPQDHWVATCYLPEYTPPPGDLAVFEPERKSIVLAREARGSLQHPLRLQNMSWVLVNVAPCNVPAAQPHRPPPTHNLHKRPRSVTGTAEDANTSLDLGNPSDEDSSGSQAAAAGGEAVSDSGSETDDEQILSAMEARDVLTIAARRRPMRNYLQDKCICAGRATGKVHCVAPGAVPFTVIAFGEYDPVMAKLMADLRRLATGTATAAQLNFRYSDEERPPNCMLTHLHTGVPKSPSWGRVPILLTTTRVHAGEEFVVASPPLNTASSTLPIDGDLGRYLTIPEVQREATRVRSATEGPWRAPELLMPLLSDDECAANGSSAAFAWRIHERYYYGNHDSLALPPEHAVVEFPFTLLRVRPSTKLMGEAEVVAQHFIPKGTCFLYCGPRQRHSASSSETSAYMMNIDRVGRRCIEGGNIMKFVNHHFGFAEQGNVAFRRGAIMYRSSTGHIKETHMVFFVATSNIAAGELLLAESYGAEYDAYIERIALCRGAYVSAEERDAAMKTGVMLPAGYTACYLSSIRPGSLIGRRAGGSARNQRSSVRIYLTVSVHNDSVDAEPIDLEAFPLVQHHTKPLKRTRLRKSEVFLLLPGWDYGNGRTPDGRPCAKLLMSLAALECQLL